MNWIYKYKIDPNKNGVDMHEGAKILSVQAQGPEIMLWASVDTTKRVVRRLLEVCPTGTPAPASRFSYLATVQLGDFVFHVFDAGDVTARARQTEDEENGPEPETPREGVVREELISAHTAAMQLAGVSNPERIRIEFDMFNGGGEQLPHLYSIIAITPVEDRRKRDEETRGSGNTLTAALVDLRNRLEHRNR